MATTFEVIYLGTLPVMDTTQGNEIAENAAGLLGTYGTVTDPLHANVQTLSSERLTEDDNSTYDTDNGGGYDSFRIDGGTPQLFDASALYDATISYVDGTSATISAIIFQDVDGNTYLAPEATQNADQAALTTKPIQSLSLNSVLNDGGDLGADRPVADFKAVVDGTAGNDTITLMSGYVDSEGDSITNGDDFVFADDGDDYINAGDGNDVVYGERGNDTIIGDDGDDLLIGNDGDDHLESGRGTDTVFGGDGQDVIAVSDDHGTNLIAGGSGYDQLVFATPTSASGVTVTWSGDGAGAYDFNATSATGTFLTIEQSSGTVYADTYNASSDTAGVSVYASDGNDTLIGGSGADRLYGESGDDVSIGRSGDDSIDGGDGNDLLYGDDFPADPVDITNSGFDSGSTGWTTTGAGTFVYAPGGDNAMAFNANNNGTGGTAQQKIATQPGAEYALSLNAFEHDLSGGAADHTLLIEVIDANGQVITSQTEVIANEASEVITLNFIAADESVILRFSNPTSTGSNDTDLMIDNVTVTPVAPTGSGNDTLVGGAGADTIFAGGGDDVITGGAGNDSLSGDAGSDLFVIQDGFGLDTISGGEGTVDLDTIDLTALKTSLKVNYTSDEAGTITDGTNTITFSEIEHLILTDGSDFVDASADRVGAWIEGRGGNDTLNGGDGDDTLDGGVGRDTLDGGAGDDTMLGGAGNDSFVIDGGKDKVIGGTGRDNAYIGDGFNGSGIDLGGDEISIDNGGLTDFLSFYDVATSVDIVFTSGTGGTAISGAGETLTFSYADGFEGAFGVGGTFDASLAAYDVVFYDYGGMTSISGSAYNDLLVAYGADPLSVTDRFYDGGTGNDTIDTGDGNDTIFGGDGDDSITSREGDDSILGGAGSDTIDAWLGNDTLNGGDGDDLLRGGADNDLLIAGNNTGVGDTLLGEAGDDTLIDSFWNATLDGGGGSDIIQVGYGTATVIGGEDLVGTDFDRLAFDLADDAAFVRFTGDEAGVYSDSDGDSGVFSEIEAISGSSKDDSIDATLDTSGVSLSGLGGNDTIAGGSGADIITGGTGDDLLTGGDRDDRFDYVAGDGLDTITDFNVGNSGALLDGDTTNNDYIDLSSYYDNIFEVWADQDDDGILNQSNTTDTKGNTTDYSDNIEFATGQGIRFDGASADNSFFTADNTGVVCFAKGTQIRTTRGDVPIEYLSPGDKVITRDNGPQELVWVGARRLGAWDLMRAPKLRPVLLAPELIGANASLIVSPQHGVLFKDEAGDETLVRATHLARMRGGKARVMQGCREVSYYHLAFAAHQIIFANGAATESFYPGPHAVGALTADARADLRALFPGLVPIKASTTYGHHVRPIARYKNLPEHLGALAQVAH